MILVMGIAMISDTNGRALEYCLTDRLSVLLNNAVPLSGKTKQDQDRDLIKFQNLSSMMQNYYLRQCSKIAEWINGEKINNIDTEIVINRLTDNDARNGNVSDISIIANNFIYNISLKHNNDAVKHQRPGGLYKQMCLSNTSDIEYKRKIKEIEASFFKKINGLDFLLFSDVKEFNSAIIDDLYSDMCNVITNEINSNCNNAGCFFGFLVGNTDFDKIIITEKEIKIMMFSGIHKPKSVLASTKGNSYINLLFDNGFVFSMRLHTASSRFDLGGALSLKFDTRLISDSVDIIYL